MRNFKTYLIIAFLIFQFTLAQKIMEFENIAIDQGLSQYSVHTILQDSRGFLWFGTQDGLDKYDGHDFTHYKNKFDDTTTISSNNISSIVEDKYGYLWIGTTNGLNRYDPLKNTFKRFYHKPGIDNSISSNEINSICVDAENNIWVGTNDKGLNQLKLTKDQIFLKKFSHNVNDENSISSDIITDIKIDKKGTIWVGTVNGLNRFDKSTGKFAQYKNKTSDKNSLSGNNISALFIDSKGIIWIGCDYLGLCRLEFSGTEYNNPMFQHFSHNSNDEGSISSNRIDVIYEDKKGTLWIGTVNNGLNKLMLKNRKYYFEKYFSDLSNPNSLANNAIRYIEEGKDGILWVGTGMGGVSKIKFHKKNFKTYKKELGKKNTLNNSIVITLYEDLDTNLWIGTLSDGLNKLNRNNGTFTQYLDGNQKDNSLNIDICLGLWVDPESNFWIGGLGKGLIKIKYSRNRFWDASIKYFNSDTPNLNWEIDNNVNIVYNSPNDQNVLWLGTDNGFGKFNIKTEELKIYKNIPNEKNSLSDNNVKSLLEDENGILWIGTRGGGLNILDCKSDKFSNYTFNKDDTNSISNNYVRCIHKDKFGNIWLGTDGGGLTKMYFTPGDSVNYKFKRITTENGLSNNVVYGILEDNNNNLWMSTNRGISKYNIIKNSFTNFRKNDGLQNDEFNTGAYFKSVSGEMFFGGISGFNSFYPDSIKLEGNIKKPVLTDFQIFFESIAVGQKINDRIILDKVVSEKEIIELDYLENTISIKYSSQFYSDPEKVKYAYILDGFEAEFNYVGNRNFAIYTNLDPGEYVFKVKSTLYNNRWNNDYTNLKIIIHPPFWLTWWFRSLILLLIIMTMISIYLIRFNRIKKQNQWLEENNKLLNEEIKKRIVSEKERERLNLILKSKNIELEQIVYVSSHDLRSPLVNIEGYSKEIELEINNILKIISESEIPDELKNSILTLSKKNINESFDFVEANVKKMGRLLSGLLIYSRLNRESINPKIINMEEVINRIVNEIKKYNSDKYDFNITISNLPECYGDIKLISEVFKQVIMNAVKYLDPIRKGEIKISGNLNDSFTEYVIEDNGIGIDQFHVDKIFDIFHKLQPEGKEGEGIGLAITRAIILKHNGTIEVESSLGKGTRFIIKLPT